MRSPMLQRGQRLHVEIGAGVAARHQFDRDLVGVGQQDRAVRQRVRRDRHQHPARNRRMQQRPAGRQRIGRRAGGRRDDQAVGALVGHEVPADRHAQLDHARGGAAVDHHVVHGQRVEHDCAVAHHLRMHQAAMVFLVLAGQHRDQRGLVVVERNVGDEAEPAAVDADQRHAVAAPAGGRCPAWCRRRRPPGRGRSARRSPRRVSAG